MSEADRGYDELLALRERYAIELKIVDEKIAQQRGDASPQLMTALQEERIALETQIESVEKKIDEIKAREPYESARYETSAAFPDPGKALADPVLKAEQPDVDWEQKRRDEAVSAIAGRLNDRIELEKSRLDGLDAAQAAVNSLNQLGNPEGVARETTAEIKFEPHTPLEVLPPTLESIAVQATIGAIAAAEMVKQGIDYVRDGDQRVEEALKNAPSPSKENEQANKLLEATEADIQQVAADEAAKQQQEQTIFEQRQAAREAAEAAIRAQREAEERERRRVQELLDRDSRG